MIYDDGEEKNSELLGWLMGTNDGKMLDQMIVQEIMLEEMIMHTMVEMKDRT